MSPIPHPAGHRPESYLPVPGKWCFQNLFVCASTWDDKPIRMAKCVTGVAVCLSHP